MKNEETLMLEIDADIYEKVAAIAAREGTDIGRIDSVLGMPRIQNELCHQAEHRRRTSCAEDHGQGGDAAQRQQLLRTRQSPADGRGADDERPQEAQREDSGRDSGGEARNQSQPRQLVRKQARHRRKDDQKRIEEHPRVIELHRRQGRQQAQHDADEDGEEQDVIARGDQEGTAEKADDKPQEKPHADDPEFTQLIAEKALRK